MHRIAAILILLMQKHLEFQIVTPRTLADFHGQTLVLPDVRVLSDEREELAEGIRGAGEEARDHGNGRDGNRGSRNVVRFPECPGKAYNAALEKDFEHASPDSQQEFLGSLQGGDAVRIKAGPHVATSIARTSDGHLNAFFANFAGLVGGSNPIQTPQAGVEVSVKSSSRGRDSFFRFWGRCRRSKEIGTETTVTFTLPAITKGAVFWYEQ